jgi:hypothetical protein
MPRKPNYDFERRERDRLKAVKTAQKAEAKRLQRELDRSGSAAENGASAPESAAD